jgi:DNA-binding response OmpR family regulator
MPQADATASARAAGRLLVVDDEPSLRLALGEYFVSLGWRVRCVTSAAAADLLRARRGFDAVILGLPAGPPVDSAAALELIALARASARRARIVLFTTAGGADLERAVRARGADAVVYKPQALAALAEHVCVARSAEPKARR